MSRHVMLDIETLGGSPDGCLVEIGAVMFQLVGNGQLAIDRYFEVYIDPESSQNLGMHIDASTVKWWTEQGGWRPPVAPVKDDSIPLRGLMQVHDLTYSLEEFASAFPWSQLEGVWTNAPLFDFVILRRAYELIHKKCPWHYRQERCCRTLFWLARRLCAPGEFALPERLVDKHRALNDASYQASVLAYLLKVIR